jgi:hypothetical protein
MISQPTISYAVYALYAVYLGLIVISVLISLFVAFRFLKDPEAIKLESRKFLLPLVVCFGLTLASFFLYQVAASIPPLRMSCSVGGYAVPATLTCRGDPDLRWEIYFVEKTGEEKATPIYESSGPTLTFNVTQPGNYWIARITDPLFSFLGSIQLQTVSFGPSADFSSAEQVPINFKVENQPFDDTAQASCTAPCRVLARQSGFATLEVPINENRRLKYAYIKEWEQSDAQAWIVVLGSAPVLLHLHAFLVGGISPKPFGLRFAPSFIRGEIIVAVERN